jgi:hypothetical protein
VSYVQPVQIEAVGYAGSIVAVPSMVFQNGLSPNSKLSLSYLILAQSLKFFIKSGFNSFEGSLNHRHRQVANYMPLLTCLRLACA